MHSRRWLPYLGGVLLLGLIVAGLWPQPLPVEIAKVTAGPLRATVDEEGKTRIKHRYVISAPVAGQLRRIPFKAGDEVRAKETVLAIIDPASPSLLDARTRSLAEARRDTAAANVERSTAAHDFATNELRRFDNLFSEKTISIQELEGARWRETSAAKELAAAQSALREAEAELATFSSDRFATTHNPVEIKSPVNGRVLRLFEENNRSIAAGMPLLEVGDPWDIEVVVHVLSRDGAAIVPGAEVELEQWGGNQPLKARVRLVEPAAFTKVSALGVEEQRVNVVADFLTPPEDRRNLGDAFRVESRIVIWQTNRAMKVASGALFRRGDQWGALVVVNGRASLRQVHVGRSSGTEMQILDGLKEGEELILYPGDRIRDGQRVKPIKI